MSNKFDYIIVGAGMAGSAAAVALRAADANASIALLGAEAHPPYDRPPLSKALWKDGKEDDVWRAIGKAKVDLQTGCNITAIDPKAHTVSDETGIHWRYGKLLIATGGTPRKLPFGGDNIVYFRTLDDYRRVRAAATPGAAIAVIGGGFIGSEIAASLASSGCKVTMLFPESGIGARAYPKALSESVTAYYRDKGVDVRTGVTANGMKDKTLELSDDTTLAADLVVAGLGIIPNVDLAKAAGLEVDSGIVVNKHLQTSDPDIYAAGDVAQFPAPALGRSMRVEHEDAALNTGACAAQCMAGQDKPYEQLPFFYSDLFDLGYEAVGTLDAQLKTVEQWVTPYREGVVYYLDGDRVRGVLLWNTWDQVDAARALIAEAGPFNAQNVQGRLPQD